MSCAKCGSQEHAVENCTSDPHCSNCDGDHPAYSRSCPAWKREKEIITLKVNENISYKEARNRLSFVQLSYADAPRAGVTPQRPFASARFTHSGPRATSTPATSSTPTAEAVRAAPPPTNTQASGSAVPGPSAKAESPKSLTPARGHRERASSVSAETMDTTQSLSAPQTPKDRRGSKEPAKKEKPRIRGPEKAF